MATGTLIGGVLAVAATLPLAWKWQLSLGRTLLATAASALAAGAGVALAGEIVSIRASVAAVAAWLSTLALVFAVLVYRFYRDPERTSPAEAGVVLSPSDGEVAYVRRAAGGILPASTKRARTYALEELTKTPLRSGDAVVIGIALNLLDVHVNRSPIAGRVTFVRRFPGSFGSLRRPEMVFANERATFLFEAAAGFQVAVVLIASRLVRRIVTFRSAGEEVTAGQRIGAIRFGSQVDLVLPAQDALRVAVRPGDRVVAGESIVAVLNPVQHPPAAATASGGPSDLDTT